MKGMIFDAASVQQILAGTKTQTRRIIKPQPIPDWIRPCVGGDGVAHGYCGSGPEQGIKSRYKAGETVYIKEAYAVDRMPGLVPPCTYKADGPTWLDYKSPLFMPESLSRIKLQIMRIEIERVQDISMEDCIKEGVWSIRYTTTEHNWFYAWQRRWIKVNGQVSWDSNPWVWVISFAQVAV